MYTRGDESDPRDRWSTTVLFHLPRHSVTICWCEAANMPASATFHERFASLSDVEAQKNDTIKELLEAHGILEAQLKDCSHDLDCERSSARHY